MEKSLSSSLHPKIVWPVCENELYSHQSPGHRLWKWECECGLVLEGTLSLGEHHDPGPWRRLIPPWPPWEGGWVWQVLALGMWYPSKLSSLCPTFLDEGGGGCWLERYPASWWQVWGRQSLVHLRWAMLPCALPVGRVVYGGLICKRGPAYLLFSLGPPQEITPVKTAHCKL